MWQMPNPPAKPKVYHITHVDNLPRILADGCLLSDSAMNARGGPQTIIGMSTIKARRLSLPVTCHNGDCVGEYVPFYFCPRSVMLYIIYKGNHPEIKYRDGQGPIVHLEADLSEAIDWANRNSRRWAFTLSNAGAIYTEFRSTLDQLQEINWDSVAASDWRASEVKESKQAEFLVHESFPWKLIERVGVVSASLRAQVRDILGTAGQPVVEIRPDWYY
jgi:ssDNA thymidine ADP-ribosyltransferase, DarT